MKKTILSLTIPLILLNSTAHASVASDLLTGLLDSGQAIGFNAINNVIITDNVNLPGQGVPSPGDTFAATGYAVIDANIDGAELTASYSISGTFTAYDPATGQLFFNHGLPNVSSQMNVFLDTAQNANEDSADSYTDGLKIATFDAVPDKPGENAGHFSAAGGADKATFKLIDSEREQLGIEDQDVLFEIETEIFLADIVDGDMVFPLFFGAFDCGSTPFNSCSREIGTGKLSLSLTELPVVIPPSDVPLPPALGLFLSGLGLLGWFGNKRKTA